MLGRIIVAWINGWRAVRNGWRQLRRRRVDFVRIELSGSLPEFAPDVAWWQQRFLRARSPVSLMGLRRQFQRIAADPQTSGVLLVVNDLDVGGATAQSLQAELRSFRQWGKQVIVYVPSADTRTYYALCPATAILMPPTAYVNLLGVRIEAQFLRDSLRMVGIDAEVVAVSPYKSGADQFTRSDMSPENREQLERLLEQSYERLVITIASERNLAPDQVRDLIDQAPFTAQAAVAGGLVDAALYEDELDAYLDQRVPKTDDKEREIVVREWDAATKALRIPYRTRQKQLIAVVSVEGAIATGKARRSPLPLPLIGGTLAGSDSIAQALRRVEQNKRIAALVLHVDSPGGDAFASDLIWREVLRIQRAKPVVVSMGNVAASGGYYVAACANAIVAQPATLTGSIGVYTLRPVASDLLDRLGVRTEVLSRGAHSGLLSVSLPLSDEERAVIRRSVFDIYATFKQRVRSGRNLSSEQLEPIAGGRVWTGAEAVEIGLVDLLGGLPTAITKARELAKLPVDPHAPVLQVLPGNQRDTITPQPFPAPTQLDLPALLHEALQTRTLAALPWIVKEI